MAVNRSLLVGSASLLLLKLLEQEDMYGYQMIEEPRHRSDHTFDLKAGTLSPLLHTLELKGYVEAREELGATARPADIIIWRKQGAVNWPQRGRMENLCQGCKKSFGRRCLSCLRRSLRT